MQGVILYASATGYTYYGLIYINSIRYLQLKTIDTNHLRAFYNFFKVFVNCNLL